MGLLEKAGKMNDDKPKKAKKAKPVKASKVETKDKLDKAIAKKTASTKKTRKARAPRNPRVLPEGFQPAGRAAKGARRLVDFIVNYSGVVALIGFTATGAFFDPTLFLIAAVVPILLNMFFLPAKTNRTVGMFLTRTRFVNSKGQYPLWIHLTMSNFTALFLMMGVALIFMATEGNKTFLVVGICMILISVADYVVTKIRHANGQQQNMWDAMFGCWFVVAEKSEDSGIKWLDRLESLGDFGEKKGWSGSQSDESDD
jgi:hypothetical protein